MFSRSENENYVAKNAKTQKTAFFRKREWIIFGVTDYSVKTRFQKFLSTWAEPHSYGGLNVHLQALTGYWIDKLVSFDF